MLLENYVHIVSVALCLSGTLAVCKYSWYKDGEVNLIHMLMLVVLSFIPDINTAVVIAVLVVAVLCCFIYLYDKYEDMLVIRKDTGDVK